MRREEADIAAQAMEALEFVGLTDRARQPAAVLPLGLKRLLEIARALAAAPRSCSWTSPPRAWTRWKPNGSRS